MKINLLIMIALTVLLVLLAPLLVMGIINLGNNIKSNDANDNKDQIVEDVNGRSELSSMGTTLILSYPSPIPTYTPLPTYTPVPTYTPLSTYTPVPTYTPYPTLTPTATLTPTQTPSPTQTPEPTPTPINIQANQAQTFQSEPQAFTPLIKFCNFSSSLIPKLSDEELKFFRANKLSDRARFFPSKIFDDETTKIVVTGNLINPPVDLYDDGTHGDDVPNDGIYSRACVSKDDLNLVLGDFNGNATSYEYNGGNLRVVNSDLRNTVSVIRLSDSLTSTKHAMFMKLGKESYKNVREGKVENLQNPKKCEACKEVLGVLGDSVDHLILVPDEPVANASTGEYTNYYRTSDNIKGIMTYGDPICDPVGWRNHGKSGNVNEDYINAIFGCPSKYLDGQDYSRLKGIIWAGSPSLNGLNAEFGHWVGIGPRNGDFPADSGISWNSLDRENLDGNTTVTGPYPITGSLWDPKRGSPYSVQVLSNNKWHDARIKKEGGNTFKLVPLNANHYQFDNILLYMMGFISYEDAKNERYYYLEDLTLDDCTTGEQHLLCSGQDTAIDSSNYKNAIEITAEDILINYGARDPKYAPGTTHLNAPSVILTEEVPSDAAVVWYDLIFGWWSTETQYNEKYGGHTWNSVTQGKSTIATGY